MRVRITCSIALHGLSRTQWQHNTPALEICAVRGLIAPALLVILCTCTARTLHTCIARTFVRTGRTVLNVRGCFLSRVSVVGAAIPGGCAGRMALDRKLVE